MCGQKQDIEIEEKRFSLESTTFQKSNFHETNNVKFRGLADLTREMYVLPTFVVLVPRFSLLVPGEKYRSLIIFCREIRQNWATNTGQTKPGNQNWEQLKSRNVNLSVGRLGLTRNFLNRLPDRYRIASSQLIGSIEQRCLLQSVNWLELLMISPGHCRALQLAGMRFAIRQLAQWTSLA